MTEIKPTSNPQRTSQERERDIRRRLGIPDDARKIIVFAESSHWDPSWIRTSEEYFQKYVRQNLDDAVSELLREPRRIYSAECVFFLRMYWDARPEQHENVRRLVNEGRLRITNSGVTAADTIVPDTEALLRDFLIGQEWLRSNGMTQEPKLAYFPDSFGHSPALPSLLKSAGFSMTAITRIDGMMSPSSYHEIIRRFPRPNSTAELLMKEKRTLDFVWRGPDGAEVLCHWNAFTYGQGDLIAHRGITRVYVFPMAFGDRSDWNVRHKIERFAKTLAPYSRTPYLFCPMGGDFVGPLPDLLTLLDSYNQRHYPKTGLWAVNAGLDDYLGLVDCHRDILPVLEIDPNPYWMGFYTSRPTFKKKCHDLVKRLLLAERVALLPENGDGQAVAKSLEDAWWYAAVSNHHDFITGTTPDRVLEGEQIPWLDKATEAASAAITRFSQTPSLAKLKRPAVRPPAVPEWRGRDRTLEIKTPYYVVQLDEDEGGSILHAWNPVTQKPLFTGVSNDLVSYYDMGGLWRMGHEFWGGRFKELRRASEHPAQLRVRELGGGLEVSCDAELDGQTIKRLLWSRSDSPVIRLRVEGMAAERRTVTVRFDTGISSSRLVMDAVGGVVVRPPQRIYNPTFWPIQHFLHFQDDGSGSGLALCLEMPGAASYRRDGRLEAIALRNATCERAYGLIPLLGLPAQGHERTNHIFDYALLFTTNGDWQENGILQIARSVSDNPWDTKGYAELRALAESAVTTDRAEVVVTAVKPASRGEGIIVRLSTLLYFGLPVAVTARDRHLKAAFLCDSRERDLKPLEVSGQTARLTMPGSIATVRLVV